MSDITAFFAAPDIQIAVVICLTVAAFIAFIVEKIPSDIVALLAMAVLLVTGIVSTNEALSVFSNSAPITIAAMFILSAALEKTGVIDLVGRRVVSIARTASPTLAIILLMAVVTILSAFINNTPVVVIMIPVAISLAHAVGLQTSKILMPLSFASIFGGTTTLIGTSTNVLIDGVAQASGLAPIGMFEITGAGLVLALVGSVYMAFAGRFLLPDRQTLTELLPKSGDRRFFTQVVIPIDSPLIEKTLREAGLSTDTGRVRVVDVFRDNTSMRHQFDSIRLLAGDRIVFRAGITDILTIRAHSPVKVAPDDGQAIFEPLESRETQVVEGVIGPNSSLIGLSPTTTGLARLYGVYVLAVHRRGENIGALKDSFHLDVGDTLLLEGGAEGLRRMFDDGILNSLTNVTERAIRTSKAPIALIAIAAVMLLAAFKVLPIAALAIIAAAAVIALGCIDHQDAYRSIRWDILMLIFGMLSLGIALEKTGTARMIVDGISTHMQGWGPIAIIALIYLVTTVMTEIMSNNATAILMTPLAVSLGHQLGVDPRPLVVAVMFAASASFATPIGYQTNTLVYSAGGYKFDDFLKVGLPLNILMMITSMLTIPLFWSF